MKRQLKKIWICNDVWMDILPSFDHAQLGLKMALLSPRFDALVDTHFNDQSELTILNWITIRKDTAGPTAKLYVRKYSKSEEFPLPDDPLPNNIRFLLLIIEYIDHAIIGFLRSNQQIFDKGTNLTIHIQSYKTESNVQPICDVLVRQIWPIFTTTNVHHLGFENADRLDNLLRITSPTILLDLNINSIQCCHLFPDAIVYSDGPNATPTAGQVLSKWLHTPRTDGRPKEFRCINILESPNLEWINSLKEAFLRATTSVSYKVNFGLEAPVDLFELENKRTNEKLTMEDDVSLYPENWLLKRSPINGETAAIQWKDGNLDNVVFMLNMDKNCIGPLSAEGEEEKEKGQNNEKVFSTTPGPSGSTAE